MWKIKKIRPEDYKIEVSDVHPLPDMVVKYKLYRAERDVEELERKLFEIDKSLHSTIFTNKLNSISIILVSLALIILSLCK